MVSFDYTRVEESRCAQRGEGYDLCRPCTTICTFPNIAKYITPTTVAVRGSACPLKSAS